MIKDSDIKIDGKFFLYAALGIFFLWSAMWLVFVLLKPYIIRLDVKYTNLFSGFLFAVLVAAFIHLGLVFLTLLKRKNFMLVKKYSTKAMLYLLFLLQQTP